MQNFVVFTLDDERFAIPLEVVERIVQAVAITRVPEPPRFVLGILNVQGRVLPVLDLRLLLAHGAREVELSDQFVLINVGGKAAAVGVDEVLGVWSCDESEITPGATIASGLECLQGVIQRDHGVVVICRPEQWLAPLSDVALRLPDQTAVSPAPSPAAAH